MDILRRFLQVFVPLFVAIDAFGLVPIYLAVTDAMPPAQRRRISIEALVAALLISIAFMFLGNSIFRLLNITQNDFRIAGGILLLVLAIMDLLSPGKPAVHEPSIVGIVPLAMPLIAGPATLTTLLVLSSTVGYGPTLLGLLANFALLLGVLVLANHFTRLLGRGTLRAFSKLVMVLLAAIAVNFIRVGITRALRGE